MKENIKQLIIDEFGKSILKVNVTEYSNLVDVALVYENGRPIKDVRQWLDKHIKNLWHIEIERVFSDDAVKKALWHLYETEDDIIYRVEEYLYELDFNEQT